MLSHNTEIQRHRDDNNMIERFFKERNSSKSTQTTYTRSIHYYETLTGHSIQECLEIAEQEELNDIHWRNTQTRKWILHYREWLYNKYNVSTAQLYLTAIITFYRHFELTIPPLPQYSKRNANVTPPVNYSDLPTREILSKCLEISSPLVRALILFMSSSGISRIDVMNLTINDYLQATSDYHNHDNSVKYAIREMREQDIIPTFNLVRQKTKQPYITFASHEACKSINAYLLTRTETLTRDRPLFKIHPRYFNTIFERLNEHFQLGKLGNGHNRFTPHMLRKYHASQLSAAGLSTDYINQLQGRKTPGVAHQHYIRTNPELLKEKYIEALPYLVVEDVEKYKTELATVKDENTELRSNLRSIINRIERLEHR